MTSGFIPLHKPIGITSQQAVSRVKRIVGCKKAGHTGTLDPAAEGLLLIALGKATRLTEYFLNGEKGYRAEVFFGRSTDTGDREGNLTAEIADFSLTPDIILKTLDGFRGQIEQTPPPASALKINGQRAYNLFRQGKKLDMPTRRVLIRSIRPLDLKGNITPSNPVLVFDVICSKGTYIRSLAMDIGAALGVPSHLAGLLRTSLSQISLNQAATFTDLEKGYQPWLLDMAVAVEKMPRLELDSSQFSRFLHGQILRQACPDGEIAVFFETRLLGIARADSGTIKPVKVLAQE